MSANPPPAAPGLTGSQALQQLLDGNKRYAAANLMHPDQTAARRIEVAQGQHPFACILGCADSRVPVEIVFDQGLGDLFVIRVAGNILDDAVLGSLEFAVAELGISLILVLGHENCGAVKAAVDAMAGGGRVPGHIGRLVDAIRPAVAEVQQHLGDPIDNAVRANVAHVVTQLQATEPILAPMYRGQRLRIAGARYDLDTGVVDVIA